MVSGDAGSAARITLGPATADMPANAIARTVLFLSSMIGLLHINWRRGGLDMDQLGPNEAALAERDLTQHYVGFVAMRHIAVRCNNDDCLRYTGTTRSARAGEAQQKRANRPRNSPPQAPLHPRQPLGACQQFLLVRLDRASCPITL